MCKSVGRVTRVSALMRNFIAGRKDEHERTTLMLLGKEVLEVQAFKEGAEF